MVQKPVLLCDALNGLQFVMPFLDAVESATRCSHPDVALAVLVCLFHAVCHAVGVWLAREVVCLGVVERQSVVCAYPQPSLSVAEDIRDVVVVDGVLISLAGEVFLEMIAIEAVQSIVGSYPHKAPLVLRDAMELGSRDVLRREYAHSCRYHERQEHNQGKGYKPRILIHLI